MAKKRLAEMVGQESERQAEPKAPAEAQDLGRTVSIGVGLKEGEVAQLDVIAKRLGFSRNAIMGWAIRHFLREHQAGRLEIPVETETKRTLGKP